MAKEKATIAATLGHEYEDLEEREDFLANNADSVEKMEFIKRFNSDELMKRQITLYNNLTGMFYTFENIIDATLKTGLKAKYIWELCYTEYKKVGNLRTYVAAFSVEECERRVAIVYE